MFENVKKVRMTRANAMVAVNGALAILSFFVVYNCVVLYQDYNKSTVERVVERVQVWR